MKIVSVTTYIYIYVYMVGFSTLHYMLNNIIYIKCITFILKRKTQIENVTRCIIKLWNKLTSQKENVHFLYNKCTHIDGEKRSDGEWFFLCCRRFFLLKQHFARMHFASHRTISKIILCLFKKKTVIVIKVRFIVHNKNLYMFKQFFVD